MRRFSLADLPGTIPVFPLPGALLLPRARLPLNIFEPRYLAMLDDTLKSRERTIGMVQPLGRAEGLHRIGCAGRVVQFTEADDGRYLVTLAGLCRFRLGEEQGGFTPYRRFRVDWSSFERDLGPAEHDAGFDRERFLDLLTRYFAALRLASDWETLKTAKPELLINSLSIICPFETEEKQALLEAPSLETRRETLVTLMEFALRGGREGGLQ